MDRAFYWNRNVYMYVGLIYVLLLVMTPVLAQTTSTQILGTVVDPTGLAVPDAAVEALRVHTGEKRTATTNEAGDYIIPYSICRDRRIPDLRGGGWISARDQARHRVGAQSKGPR